MIFQISKARWSILFACLCMLVLGISDNIRGPLFPELLRYFNLANSIGSLSFAVASGAAFFGTVGITILLKKFQLNRLLWISMLLMGSGLFIMAAAPAYWGFIIGAFVFGASLGSVGVAQNLLITENVDSGLQPRALSGLHGVYGFSSLIAPWLASRSPIWFSGEWRSAYYVTGLLAVLVMFLIISTKPQSEFYRHVRPTGDNPQNGNLRGKLWLSGFFASYVGAEILVSTRLALYMRTYFTMDLQQSSNYVSLFFVFLLVGRLIFTFKSFVLPLKTQLNIFLFFSLMALVLGLWLHPFFLTLVGFTMAPFYPLAIVYISEMTGVAKRQYITFVMGIQSLCVILMHVGVGYITDSFGLFYAFGIGIFLLAFALFCLNFHPEAVV